MIRVILQWSMTTFSGHLCRLLKTFLVQNLCLSILWLKLDSILWFGLALNVYTQNSLYLKILIAIRNNFERFRLKNSLLRRIFLCQWYIERKFTVSRNTSKNWEAQFFITTGDCWPNLINRFRQKSFSFFLLSSQFISRNPTFENENLTKWAFFRSLRDALAF